MICANRFIRCRPSLSSELLSKSTFSVFDCQKRSFNKAFLNGQYHQRKEFLKSKLQHCLVCYPNSKLCIYFKCESCLHGIVKAVFFQNYSSRTFWLISWLKIRNLSKMSIFTSISVADRDLFKEMLVTDLLKFQNSLHLQKLNAQLYCRK